MEFQVVAHIGGLQREFKRMQKEVKKLPKSGNKNPFMRMALKYQGFIKKNLKTRPTIAQTGGFMGNVWPALKGRRSVGGFEVPLWGGFRQHKKTVISYVEKEDALGKFTVRKKSKTGKLEPSKRADGRKYRKGDKQLDKVRAAGMIGEWLQRPEYTRSDNWAVRIGTSKDYGNVHAYGSKDGKTPARNWYKSKMLDRKLKMVMQTEIRRFLKALIRG